jgi:hypothetical protein
MVTCFCGISKRLRRSYMCIVVPALQNVNFTYPSLRRLLIEIPSKLAQLVRHLTCIRDVPSLNSGRNTDYPEVFHGFPQSLLSDRFSAKTQAVHTDARGGIF